MSFFIFHLVNNFTTDFSGDPLKGVLIFDKGNIGLGCISELLEKTDAVQTMLVYKLDICNRFQPGLNLHI